MLLRRDVFLARGHWHGGCIVQRLQLQKVQRVAELHEAPLSRVELPFCALRVVCGWRARDPDLAHAQVFDLELRTARDLAATALSPDLRA